MEPKETAKILTTAHKIKNLVVIAVLLLIFDFKDDNYSILEWMVVVVLVVSSISYLASELKILYENIKELYNKHFK